MCRSAKRRSADTGTGHLKSDDQWDGGRGNMAALWQMSGHRGVGIPARAADVEDEMRKWN